MSPGGSGAPTAPAIYQPDQPVAGGKPGRGYRRTGSRDTGIGAVCAVASPARASQLTSWVDSLLDFPAWSCRTPRADAPRHMPGRRSALRCA